MMKKTVFTLVIAFAAIVGSTACGVRNSNAAADAAEAQETVAGSNTEEPAAYRVATIPADVKGSDVLAHIKKDFEGKVVLVDFWATWCPPCRAAMTEIDAIKPALQQKGAEFVYVTGETSPLADWEEMIKKIDGVHYRLTKQQWNDLCAALEIPGIPVYLLLNKDGSTAWDNLKQGGYPGNELVQNQMEVALTK